MHEFYSYLIFLLTISIPTIAIVAELSKKTPSSILYSLTRSIICIGSLFFLSVVLDPKYVPTVTHLITIGFIFSISVFQLYFELQDSTLNSFLKNKLTNN